MKTIAMMSWLVLFLAVSATSVQAIQEEKTSDLIKNAPNILDT